MNVDTYARFRTFEEAWGRDGDGLGTWQSDRDAGRTTTAHGVVGACCPTCGRSVQISVQRLAGLLRSIWAPGATTRQSWTDAGTAL